MCVIRICLHTRVHLLERSQDFTPSEEWETCIARWMVVYIDVIFFYYMKDLTCADMLHIHAVHQPSAGVYVVEAAFLGLCTISLWHQLTRITFCISVWYQVMLSESISHFPGDIPVTG